jgi:predicted nucleotidyltransferase
MDNRTLLKEKRDVILAAARRHGVRNIRIFGSVARGEDDSESDIDFLVDMEPGRSVLDHASLLIELQQLLRERVLREAIPL